MQSNATWNIGVVFEEIQVLGKRLPSNASPVRTPQRIRVSGQVQATKLLQMVKPAYPAAAQTAGIEGTVLLQATIGVDGTPLSITAMSKTTPEELVQAAMEAVRQWRYEPTRLNGVPVEVVTVIAVSFRLEP